MVSPGPLRYLRLRRCFLEFEESIEPRWAAAFHGDVNVWVQSPGLTDPDIEVQCGARVPTIYLKCSHPQLHCFWMLLDTINLINLVNSDVLEDLQHHLIPTYRAPQKYTYHYPVTRICNLLPPSPNRLAFFLGDNTKQHGVRPSRDDGLGVGNNTGARSLRSTECPAAHLAHGILSFLGLAESRKATVTTSRSPNRCPLGGVSLPSGAWLWLAKKGAWTPKKTSWTCLPKLIQ